MKTYDIYGQEIEVTVEQNGVYTIGNPDTGRYLRLNAANAAWLAKELLPALLERILK